MIATAQENILLSLLERKDIIGTYGLLSLRKGRTLCYEIAQRVDIPSIYMKRAVVNLSGGNQQKVLFGKGFGRERDIYIFDEPTVGVDMGTRAALYRLIKEIAEAGKAVVLISSDLPEVMNLAHRLLVFSHGRIATELVGPAITEENVLKHFFTDVRNSAWQS